MNAARVRSDICEWPRPPYQWPLWIGVADAPPATVRQETSPADITVDLTSFPAGSGGTARLAPHRYRIAALAVDVFIVVVVFGVLAVLGRLAEEALKVDLVSLRTTAVALTVCVAVVLGLTVWLTNGQTIGKALFGLAERRVDGKPLRPTVRGLGWAIGRHSVGYLVVDVLGVGMLAAFGSSRRRCLHDLAFSSEVLFVSPEDAGLLSWRDRLTTRFTIFTRNLEAGAKRIKERHHRVGFLWRWLTAVITGCATPVFGMAKLITPAGVVSHGPSTAAAGSVHPATALTAKPAAALWASTAAATAGAGLALAVAFSGASVNRINVAFAFGTVGQPETDEIYVMHADGSHLRQLTHNATDDNDPNLFGDRLIAFDSDRDGNNEIYTMNADGTHQRRLTNNTANDAEPAWSPDGQQKRPGRHRPDLHHERRRNPPTPPHQQHRQRRRTGLVTHRVHERPGR